MNELNEEIAQNVYPLLEPGREAPSLADELLEAGVPEQVVEAVEQIFERRVESHGAQRAAEALRHIATLLANTPPGLALRRVLLGAQGRSLADDAKLAGVKKQTLHESVGRVQRRIKIIGLQITP